MVLRRFAYAGSLVSSVVAIIAHIEDWAHPLAWLAAALGCIALAGLAE